MPQPKTPQPTPLLPTIVLPVHNGERDLQRRVAAVLEVAADLGIEVRVAVVDDGSVDQTYEAACEISRVFPQVAALRQPVRSGLKAVLRRAGQRYPGAAAIVHNGVDQIDAGLLRSMLEPLANRGSAPASHRSPSRGSRRLGELQRLQENMERAHRSPGMFIRVRLEESEAETLRKPAPAPKGAAVAPATWTGSSMTTGMPQTF
ncbi:MAG: glycosyltransferase [Planctomycetota bacterium]